MTQIEPKKFVLKKLKLRSKRDMGIKGLLLKSIVKKDLFKKIREVLDEN